MQMYIVVVDQAKKNVNGKSEQLLENTTVRFKNEMHVPIAFQFVDGSIVNFEEYLIHASTMKTLYVH